MPAFKRIDFDIETDNLLAEVTRLWCIVIRDWDTDEEFVAHGDLIPRALEIISNAEVVCGHNIVAFDIPALEKLYPDFSVKGKTLDTLLLSQLIYTDMLEMDAKNNRIRLPGDLMGRHSMKAWGYRLGVLKGTFGETEAWDKFTSEMLEYCRQDVRVQGVIRRHFLEKIEKTKWPEYSIRLEHEFATILSRMHRTGFVFNEAAAHELTAKITAEYEASRRKLTELLPPKVEEMKTPEYWTGVDDSGREVRTTTKGEAQKRKLKSISAGPMRKKATPFNPSSRQQVVQYLLGRGWEPTEFTKSGQPELDEDTLMGLAFPEGKELARFFLLNKRLGQLANGNQAWLKLVRGGKIHGEVVSNGAVTGRCAHKKPNIAQVPKVTSPFGVECRALFGPLPGMVLIGADASGLELRCLSHYLFPWDGGAYSKIVCEGDVHTANQKAFELPPGKAGRDQSKTLIYATVYGAGDEKRGSIVDPLTDKDTKKRLGAGVLEKFKQNTPGFGELVEQVATVAFGPVVGHRQGRDGRRYAIRDSKRARGWLKGLDGRRLRVRSEHAALNTLLQSAGALLVKRATVLWYQILTEERGLTYGVDFVLHAHVHDEIQAGAKPEHAELVGKTFVEALQRAGQEMKFTCPLSGEFKIGSNWAETH